MKRIAIIGGGAAGMIAAATLLEENTNTDIYLFDKNPVLGKKVSISGGGRCNVTTGITDKNTLLSKYIRGSKFLIPAINTFPPEKVFKWFEDHNVPLKIEKDLRVFPQSDIGSDIVKVFETLFKKKIHTCLNETIKSLEPNANDFHIETNKNKYSFNIVLITSGGNAYKHTGSSGDGYDFAKACGHTITKLGPSLNSFEVKENWCKELSGISLESVKLETLSENKTKISASGPFLFTHFGISGPVTFTLSSHLAFNKISKETPITISLFPYSKENFDTWNNKLLNIISENSKKQINHILSEILPKRLSEEVLKIANIKADKKGNEISKEERKKISHLLSGELKLTLISRRPGDEFVTAGGVSLEEVNKKTMESKLTPNLYFAGEVLDIDGLTGGFNLQSSWATGRLAGISIAKKLKIKN